MNAYLTLLATGFVAATLLPASSEALLLALLAGGDYAVWGLWGAATVGNTLGAMVNWALGRWCLRFQDKRWFPIKPGEMGRAERWFSRFGVWSLLLAWVPVVGDPLTFVAGVLRVDFRLFSLLVLVGKGARYAAVILAARGLFAL